MSSLAAKLQAAAEALLGASHALAEAGVIELEPTILLTPAEAAEQMRVSTSLVYRLANERRIPSCHVAGALRIPRAALLAWIDGQQEARVGLTVVGGSG